MRVEPEGIERERIEGTLVARGRQVLEIECAAIESITGRLGDEFARAIDLLYCCSGKVVLTGIGKSGIIAQKITATFNSTGTPAFFLHPVDALHGDLGMVQSSDIVVILSKSGDTPELAGLLPALTALQVQIVALTAVQGSLLARHASVVLNCAVDREACPYDLAPTASTTAMLAMGDALAVVLYEKKGFSPEDFAATHPGGQIGRRLLLKLEDIMKTGDDIPTVHPDADFRSVLLQMSGKRLGATLVVDGARLLGIVTDGDLRRLFERYGDVGTLKASEMMTPGPMTAPPDMLGSAALMLLEQNKRTQLPVTDSNGEVLGIVHLHDLIEMGLKQ